MVTVYTGTSLQPHACRLYPGDDLVSSLLDAARQAGSAVIVVSAVGSLSTVTLRMASASVKDNDEANTKTWDQNMEVLSLQGTICPQQGCKHIHMSLSDSDGNTVGGHLISGTVYTTLELVLATVVGVDFKRVLDAETGYTELEVSTTTTPPPRNESDMS